MKQFRGLILKWREKISSFFCISKGWEDTERCSCIIRKNRSLGERISEESTEVESIMLAAVDESHKINILLKK